MSERLEWALAPYRKPEPRQLLRQQLLAWTYPMKNAVVLVNEVRNTDGPATPMVFCDVEVTTAAIGFLQLTTMRSSESLMYEWLMRVCASTNMSSTPSPKDRKGTKLIDTGDNCNASI